MQSAKPDSNQSLDRCVAVQMVQDFPLWDCLVRTLELVDMDSMDLMNIFLSKRWRRWYRSLNQLRPIDFLGSDEIVVVDRLMRAR
jgi:hypothetical protein